MAVIRHEAIMDAADAYARAVAYQRDDYRSAQPQRDALEAEAQALTEQLRGAVDLLREVYDLLAPADVDDPSAVPLAVDKLAAYLDGGQ